MTRYLYHSTTMDRLPGIMDDGLVPSDAPRWEGVVAFQSKSKVFLTNTPQVAGSYSAGLIQEELMMEGISYFPVLLRMKEKDISGLTAHIPGDFYTRRKVKPESLEVYVPDIEKWLPLRKAMIWFHGSPIEIPDDLTLAHEESARVFSNALVKDAWPPGQYNPDRDPE